jgi:Zn-dependent protease with chaperone function/uncharacterized tellurite resistance protein B-like protein
MSTNFFENQEQARRMTNRLVVLFALAVLAIVGAVVALFHFLFAQSAALPWQFYLSVVTGTLIVIGIGMLVRTVQVAAGGPKIAMLLGGVRVSPNSKDDLERRLIHVVEEMAIASGIPMPELYILPQEAAINAFAAGLTPATAVIGVTRGALEKLNRDELQGVIAHEFSHIFNGDMRLNVRLISVLGGITALSTLGYILVRSLRGARSSRGKGGGGVAVIALAGVGLLVIGSIGVFFARLIKAAVSRQREFLADASAVQYTRNPEGIGGALLRISHDQDHALIKSSFAEETSHMFFGSVIDFSSMFATHPPLSDRIKRIHPNLLRETPEGQQSGRASSGLGSGMESMGISAMAGESGPGSRVVQKIGEVDSGDVRAARDLLQSLPEIALEASRTPEGAKTLVMALLLGNKPEVLRAQQTIIRELAGAPALEYVTEISRQLAVVPSGIRMPLLELSLPALRELSEQEAKMLMLLLQELVQADRQYHMFEYVVLTFIGHHIGRQPKRKFDHIRLSAARRELNVLVSAVSRSGVGADRADSEIAAQTAFNQVAQKVRSLGIEPEFLRADDSGPKALEAAINRLKQLAPLEKEKLIELCVNLILSDRQVSPEEVEILQAVCVSLEVPAPSRNALLASC